MVDFCAEIKYKPLPLFSFRELLRFKTGSYIYPYMQRTLYAEQFYISHGLVGRRLYIFSCDGWVCSSVHSHHKSKTFIAQYDTGVVAALQAAKTEQVYLHHTCLSKTRHGYSCSRVLSPETLLAANGVLPHLNFLTRWKLLQSTQAEEEKFLVWLLFH